MAKTIELSRDQVAIVDDADFDWLNQWKWSAHWNPTCRAFYARRTTYGSGKRDVYMHRLILGLEYGDPREGDHVDTMQTLNNTRSNLRIATPAENSQNKRTYSNNKSGYKGVSFHAISGKWQSVIDADRKRHYLGLFSTPELAHEKRLSVAVILHGKFARESPRGR